MLDGGADTAFTAAPFHGFLWRRRRPHATGVNHDAAGRQRRQDREPEWLETGAAYAMRADGLRRARPPLLRTHRRRRRPTRPGVLEIDEPADLERARALAPLLDAADRPGPGEVDAVVLDFDGTQTDDRAWLAADGTERVARASRRRYGRRRDAPGRPAGADPVHRGEPGGGGPRGQARRASAATASRRRAPELARLAAPSAACVRPACSTSATT